MLATSGGELHGLRVVFLLINLSSIVLIYLFSRRYFDSTPSLLAAAAFSLLSMHPHMSGMFMLAEHFAVLIIISAICFIPLSGNEKHRYVRVLLSGILLGLSLSIRQNGIFFCAVGFFALFLVPPKGKRWLEFAVFFAGLALFPCLFMVVLAAQGAFNDYFYWNFEYNAKYIHGASTELAWVYLKGTMTMMSRHGYLFIALLFGFSLTAFCFPSPCLRRLRTFLILLLVASLLSILPRLTFHGHYFLYTLPAISICMAFGLNRLLPKRTNTLASILIFLLFSAFLLLNRSTCFSAGTDAYVRMVYGSNPFTESKVLADSIQSQAIEGDHLMVFGGELQLHYYTKLNSPEYCYFGPYLVDGSDEEMERQKGFIAQAELYLPRFFVAVHHPLSWVKAHNSSEYIYHWYGEFTSANYDLVGLVEIDRDQASRYYWGESAADRPLKSEFQLFLWRRKTE